MLLYKTIHDDNFFSLHALNFKLVYLSDKPCKIGAGFFGSSSAPMVLVHLQGVSVQQKLRTLLRGGALGSSTTCRVGSGSSAAVMALGVIEELEKPLTPLKN